MSSSFEQLYYSALTYLPFSDDIAHADNFPWKLCFLISGLYQ